MIRILSAVYAVFGFASFLFFAFSNTEYMALPIGIYAPLIYLGINLKLPRTARLGVNIVYVVASVVVYAVTGWITGAAGGIVFNSVARRMGGIPATFVTTKQGD